MPRNLLTEKNTSSRKLSYPASDAIEEFLDIDFGDISKSESDLYRNDSLLCGKCWSTNPGEGPSKWSRAPGPPPLSTSKLKKKSDEFYNIYLYCRIRKLSQSPGPALQVTIQPEIQHIFYKSLIVIFIFLKGTVISLAKFSCGNKTKVVFIVNTQSFWSEVYKKRLKVLFCLHVQLLQF